VRMCRVCIYNMCVCVFVEMIHVRKGPYIISVTQSSKTTCVYTEKQKIHIHMYRMQNMEIQFREEFRENTRTHTYLRTYMKIKHIRMYRMRNIHGSLGPRGVSRKYTHTHTRV
jgi:hypothetical protein